MQKYSNGSLNISCLFGSYLLNLCQGNFVSVDKRFFHRWQNETISSRELLQIYFNPGFWLGQEIAIFEEIKTSSDEASPS